MTIFFVLGLVFGEYLIKPFFPHCDEIPIFAIKITSASCISRYKIESLDNILANML